MNATLNGRYRAVLTLLEFGADTKARDCDGRTALDHAKLFGGWNVVDGLRVMEPKYESLVMYREEREAVGRMPVEDRKKWWRAVDNDLEATRAALQAMVGMTAEDRKKWARRALGEAPWTPEDHHRFPPAARAAAMAAMYTCCRDGGISGLGDISDGPGLLVVRFAVSAALEAVPPARPTRSTKPPTAVTSDEVRTMMLPRLKEELRVRKLVTSGAQPELLERLLEAVGKEEKRRCIAHWLAVDRVVGGPAYVTKFQLQA